jgi:cell division protein FtsB
MPAPTTSLASEVSNLARHLRVLKTKSIALTNSIAREEKRHAAHRKLVARRTRLQRKIAKLQKRNEVKAEKLERLKREGERMIREEREGMLKEEEVEVGVEMDAGGISDETVVDVASTRVKVERV